MTRTISFRVSEDEFEQLRSESEKQGARSVSDYARLSLCGSAGSGDYQREITIQQLSESVQRLSSDIHRLFELIESPRPRHDPDHAISAKQNTASNALR